MDTANVLLSDSANLDYAHVPGTPPALSTDTRDTTNSSNVQSLLDHIMSPSFLLPEGYNWTYIQEVRQRSSFFLHSPVESSFLPFIVAVVFLIVRYVVMHYFIRPSIHGRVVAISLESYLSPTNLHSVNESLSAKDKKDVDLKSQLFNRRGTRTLTEFSKKTDIADDQLQFLISKKRSLIEKRMKKISESYWYLVSYTFLFCFGLSACWGQPFLFDIDECFRGMPHETPAGMHWYYMLSLGFYWSSLSVHFFESRRKDFWQLFTHHIATIILLQASWMVTATKMGTIILLLHDSGDIFLQAAKVLNNLKFEQASQAAFVLFTITWTVTRLILYPFRVLYSVTFSIPAIYGFCGIYFILVFFLYLLFVLHIFWSITIFKILVTVVRSSSIRDIRSPETSDAEE